MEEPQSPRKEEMEIGEGGGFSSIGVDLQRNILLRLPAISYASASCVSRSWNHLCNQFLSRPKLLSALSLNPNLSAAVEETLDEVLSEPIRPDFAILCIRLGCNNHFKMECNERVRKRLGPRIPIIVSECYGAMGSEVCSNEFKEVMWKEEQPCEPYSPFRYGCSSEMINHGVILIVGFMPGIKVSGIPFLRPSKEPQEDNIIEKFVADIKDYATHISGCSSPAGIIMFTDTFYDMKTLLLDEMDFALSHETVIVGGETGCFLYSCGDDNKILGMCRHFQEIQYCKCAAVALVFATDRDKSHDTGEIKFNLAISNGLTSLAPIYEAAEVGVTRNERFPYSTRINVREKGSLEKLDSSEILRDIYNEIEEEGDPYCGLYIGVTKRRHCTLGPRNFRFLPTLAYDAVLGAGDGFLNVEGDRIRTGDPFCFYVPDGPTASISSDIHVVDKLKILKQKAKGSVNGSPKEEVFGGLIFSSYHRRECFFKQHDVDSRQPDTDSSAFLKVFPRVPFGGMFCNGEIGRGNLIESSMEEDDDFDDEDDIEKYNYYDSRTCLQVYSAVYLVLSYTPKPLECY